MKRSIRKQMAALFIGLMVLVMAATILVNKLYFEKFYTHRLENTLETAYAQIDEHITDQGFDRGFFTGPFTQMCNSNNMNVVVVDENYTTVIGNSTLIAARIWGYVVAGDNDDAEILITKDNYIIQKKLDPVMNMRFLEMWGTLSSGYRFMFRIPLSSISASAEIATRFILYVNLVAIIICAILIIWLSGTIARPIRELTDLAKRMANLDFDARYTSGGEDEIGQLGEHFNHMSQTLEKTISQLKSANARLQKDIDQKIQIDEMRKEFLSNVSHELKTPIALIQGYAEGLRECINDDDPESRTYYCDVIIDEAAKMNSLVGKLLTLNQLEFGEDRLEMERFDIAELISGKLQSSRILAEQKGASLTYEGETSLHVWGDQFKIEEVLTNYISNAINHVDGDMKITIRAERAGDKARISVINTGEPIPEQEIDKIWIKFYKVDKARTREYGGSGVGLSIVKAIMESHQQKFGAENTPDGVRFWFELDLAQGET
ncbi:MAG: HAMP domain-containing histidine kinase [Lachnospiraceae bacterium]|nr:HAMP domain-containing histidine kinase [Lachnospiraceae bacterium]